MICQYCSQQVADDAVSCPYCGAPTGFTPTPQPATDYQQYQYQQQPMAGDYSQQGYAQQGYAQQGYAQQSYPQTGYPQAGYGAQPGYPMAAPMGYQPVPYGVEQKSKLAGGLLGIFLGGFGAGRFYLGYTSLGIAQLLVTIFTAGIGGLWGFIDGILILTGNPSVDGNGYPLKD